MHVREVRAAVVFRGDGLASSTTALIKLQGYFSYCAACRRLLLSSLARLRDLMHDAVPKLGSTNLKRAHEHDPSKVKRARKDEDLVSRAIADAASLHMSTGKLLEVDASASSRSGHSLEEHYVLKAQSSAWLSFSRSSTLSVAADAKRLGNPAEDTICYLAIDPAQRSATWLPPQAALADTRGASEPGRTSDETLCSRALERRCLL